MAVDGQKRVLSFRSCIRADSWNHGKYVQGRRSNFSITIKISCTNGGIVVKKIIKPVTQDAGFKGELVDAKDSNDFEPTGRNMNNNPYKTPPNNLTSKRKG